MFIERYMVKSMKENFKKGFTLIELLAVIIILGILLFLAVPSVSRMIRLSKENVYIDNLERIVDAVKTDVTLASGEYKFDYDEYLVVPFVCVELEKGANSKSPFGTYVNESSFVVVIRNKDSLLYDYYITSKDGSGIGTNMVYAGELKVGYVDDEKIGKISEAEVSLGEYNVLVQGLMPKVISCDGFDITPPISLVDAIFRDNIPQSDAGIDFSKTSEEDGTKGLFYASDLSRVES